MTVVPLRLFVVPLAGIRTAGLTAAATVACAVALRDLAEVAAPVESDFGLAAALPWTFWVGLLALNVTFGATLSLRRPSTPLLALQLLLLVVVLYGAAALVEPIPRLEVSWRHLGITDQLWRSGNVDPDIDAYFSWPGFFAGTAAWFELVPVPAATLALWAPVLNGLLWAFGVVAVASSLTPSRHHAWLTGWFFVVVNWIDQDYLSPQAFGFAVYLVVVTCLLRYLGAVARTPGLWPMARAFGVVVGPRAGWRGRVPMEPEPRRRVAALLLVVVLTAVVMVSHQLTPFMLLGAVAVLTFTGRLWSTHLLWVLGLVAVLWLTTGASSYLAGHPVLFVQGVGESAGANMQARHTGSFGHLVVVQARTLTTAAALVLAALGWWRMWRQGQRDLRPLLLLWFPFVMVVLQSYGGEMLMRATLFSLPFMAYYAAGLFMGPRPGPVPLPHPSAFLVGCVASLLVVVNHYGNAAFEMFSPAEIRGVHQLYRMAPPGSLLVSTTHATPWKAEEYAEHRHATVTDICDVPLEVTSCYQVLDELVSSDAERSTYLLVTRGEQESLRIRGDAAPGVLDRLHELLRDRNGARPVFENEHVRIVRIPPLEEGQ